MPSKLDKFWEEAKKLPDTSGALTGLRIRQGGLLRSLTLVLFYHVHRDYEILHNSLLVFSSYSETKRNEVVHL